ncbi:MAG: hypothetical protein A2887_04150 [Alphaproteobacteria bacterium RIFCSPLOWO2_01_FULL_40_26]|nr:MAG: hypothetical protein A2794_00380 [Alphaproteobacteria bacterium RIFCSPHIGHO2_01_FULL_40_8]OFW93928.1 MAG: hypothetical protein A2887_04150 [Alphaproteobacteria bacterium RIFCSPLOWO2_01_FULL_40_26]OFX09422.1 MAG: hypothetical protein A3H30_01765 [Alphaproteobacteria bacterium RIFCSPLOWO2_02_FULL_40_19]OFX11199.1 MAG: hypothetical protein A3G22_02650 [Alphaproteobacteria bacterium RIFCSPLOWO2_12_FULL_40_11]
MLAHKFSLNIPDKTYRTLKARASFEDRSVSDLILFSIKKTFENEEESLRFISGSNEVFAKEWSSSEDEKAFKNLQKFRPKR